MKNSTILFIIGLLMFSIIGLTQISSAEVSSVGATQNYTYYCGDGKCNTDETPTTCEKDCSQPTTIRWGTCGDKICQTTESKSSCSVDCGYPWVCGDGICGGTETDWNCPHDCPKPATVPVPAVPAIPTTTPSIPAPTTTPSTPTPTISEPTPKITPPTIITPTTSPLKKCGVNSFGVSSECGLNVYKSVHVQCYDGYETNLGAVESSCKSSELWQQYAKEACANRCSIGGRMSTTPISVPIPTPITPPTQRPVVVAVDICNEVLQWETKIAYYKKLNNLSEDELNKSGFKREEVGKIIEELSSGIEKVRIQCNNKNNTVPAPINEIVKPVVVESGPEISTYYKAKLEKVSSIKNGGENQIQELKALRNEIDKLISNLIKSRNELEAGELNTLVKEVKVSQGEINADNIKVETTGKKIFVDVGDRAVSVEPTVDQVLIRDKGLQVNTDEVIIKENVMSVGGVPVEMSASEVAEKLGLAPTTIELKKENENAVYNMQINERRKLFGLIPFNSEKTVTANAQNGEVLGENHPWYNFLTTK